MNDFLPVSKHKGFLADLPENARTYYSPLEGAEWGRSLSEDLIKRFCETLEEAPQITTSLNTSRALLQAIDEAIEDLNPSGELIVVLVGDWWDFVFELNIQELDGDKPEWQLPEADQVGDLGRYRGHPIFQGPADDERSLYVVEPQAWDAWYGHRLTVAITYWSRSVLSLQNEHRNS